MGTGWQLTPEARRALRLDAAQSALRRRDWTKAMVEAEELLDAAPHDPDGLWVLAEAATELRDFLVAREAWTALLAVAGPRAAVFAQLAVACFECADLDGAEAAAERAVELDGDCGEALYVRALVTERTRGPDAAWPMYAAAHRLGPLAFPLPLALDAGDIEEVVRRALAELPDDVLGLWAQVTVRVEAFPDPSDLVAPVPPISPRVLALYEGDAGVNPAPSGLRIYAGNLAHHDHPDQAVLHLADTLEQEALDWLPEPPDEP